MEYHFPRAGSFIRLFTEPPEHPELYPAHCKHPVNISFFKKIFYYLFIYLFLAVLGLRLCVRFFSSCGKRGPLFIAVRGPLTVAALLQSTGSRRAGSVAVGHGPSCSAACGIFPDQGSNPCPLHWQADSQPLRHQGSPQHFLKNVKCTSSSSADFFCERQDSKYFWPCQQYDPCCSYSTLLL